MGAEAGKIVQAMESEVNHPQSTQGMGEGNNQVKHLN
jgi:hypothetical protein